MKRRGFTLVEILIVMAIVMVLAVIAVMILNPAGLLDKGKDARRKKDLERIRQAFEEYYNDKGCYPPAAVLSQLANPDNCGSYVVFSPWLKPWPCDPDGQPYYLSEDEASSCARWFKVLTNLKNENDNDVPDGWYVPGNFGVERWSPDEVNYGKSSTNVNWFEPVRDEECRVDICLVETSRSGPVCNYSSGCNSVRDGGCYLGVCKPKCLVSCCGDGCN